jgi:hypothetical protein
MTNDGCQSAAALQLETCVQCCRRLATLFALALFELRRLLLAAQPEKDIFALVGRSLQYAPQKSYSHLYF